MTYEDLLALVMVVIGAWVVYYACKLLWNKYQAHQTKKEIERVAEERRQIEATRKWRESRYQKQQVAGNSVAIQAGGNVSVGMSSSSSRVHSPSYAPSPTQSMQSYNTRTDTTLSDLADIAIIANTFHHWNDNKKESSDAPVTSSSSSSSWGFDDSDSRKSAASSFSSSDSSSSWSSSSSDSSSSWSSSDSGPSSDW